MNSMILIQIQGVSMSKIVDILKLRNEAGKFISTVILLQGSRTYPLKYQIQFSKCMLEGPS